MYINGATSVLLSVKFAMLPTHLSCKTDTTYADITSYIGRKCLKCIRTPPPPPITNSSTLLFLHISKYTYIPIDFKHFIVPT